MSAHWKLWVLSLSLATGCGGSAQKADAGQQPDAGLEPDFVRPLGTEGGDCFPNKTCNAGLVCLSDLCVRLPDAGGADIAKSDIRKPDAPKPDAPKPDAPKPDVAKPDTFWKPDQLKVDAPQKPDAKIPDAAKSDVFVVKDASKPDMQKPDLTAPKPDISTGNCGSITSYGQCQGTRAQYCDTSKSPWQLVDYDCSLVKATCGIIDPSVGVGCVMPSPCGAETPQGRCSGNTLIYCAVDGSSALVKQIPCGAATCAPSGGPGGTAGCVTQCVPGNTWCAGALLKAECTASGAVLYTDCAKVGGICQSGGSGTACTTPAPGTRTLKGTIYAPYRPATASGYSATVQWLPARFITVAIKDITGTKWEVLAPTDAQGKYSVSLPATIPNTFDLYQLAWMTTSDASVIQTLNFSGALYGSYISHTMAGTNDTLDLWINEPVGPAFYLLNDSYAATTPASSLSGPINRSLNLYWEWGKPDPLGCGSCFARTDPSAPTSSAVFYSGDPVFESHYDTSVIGHEVGHFVTWRYSRDNSPGGPHTVGTPVVPPFAWSEGLATAYSQLWIKSSFFIDANATGWFWIDLAAVAASPPNALTWPSPAGGVRQPLDELVVSSMLWSTASTATNPSIVGSLNLGFSKIWDVAVSYMKKPTNDREWPGADLLDFLDGLLCRKYATIGQVALLYVGSFKYPYDFMGPASCP